MMMFGEEVNKPVDVLMGTVVQDKEVRINEAKFVANLRGVLNKVHNIARTELGKSQVRQKRDYDVRLRINNYDVGDVVYLKNRSVIVGISPKLLPVWKGPYLVVKKFSPMYLG
jgi:hypothetical protein